MDPVSHRTLSGTRMTTGATITHLCNISTPYLRIYDSRLNFVRSYLRTVGKEQGPSEEQRLMAEIKIFCLASHLFWGLWSIVNAKLSEIPFGYWDYAVSRLKNYQYLKEKIMASEGSPTTVEDNDDGVKKITIVD